MKTIKLFTLLLLSLMIACSDSEDPAPVNQPQPGDQVAAAPTITAPDGFDQVFQGIVGAPLNGALVRKVNAVTPGGFKELRIQKIVDGQVSEYQAVDAGGADSADGHVYTLNYILNAGDVGKEVIFRATVTDQEDRDAWIDFATIDTHLPMIHSGTVVMKTDMPPDGNVQRNYFLYINQDKVQSIDMANMVTNDLDEDVAAVLSANDGYGIYLASPKALLETNLTVKIHNKRATKFKEVVMTEEERNNLTIYDLFKVTDLYAAADWGSHQQRAAQVGKNKTYTFKTDEGRMGIIVVKKMALANNEYSVTMEVFISQ